MMERVVEFLSGAAKFGLAIAIMAVVVFVVLVVVQWLMDRAWR